MLGMPEKLSQGLGSASPHPQSRETAKHAPAANLGPAIAIPAPPCSADITERSAIIQDGHGCNRRTADARALGEAGYRCWSDLADAHRVEIKHQLATLPPAPDAGLRLLKVTLAFLGSPHWQTAIGHGWPLIELFGACPVAPLVRIDRRGLVSGLALSKINDGKLEAIREDGATIVCRSGSRLVYRIGTPGMDAAELWWRCPALIGEGEYPGAIRVAPESPNFALGSRSADLAAPVSPDAGAHPSGQIRAVAA